MAFSMTTQALKRQLKSPLKWRTSTDSILRPSRFLHGTAAAHFPRKRQFFSSNANLQLEAGQSNIESAVEAASQAQKRKAVRSPPGKRSLRRVAVEAQRSREDAIRRQGSTADDTQSGNFMTAICVAEEFDMTSVVQILRTHGFQIDPHGTGFLAEQVVHTRGVNDGDIFVFPSGTLVAWSLPEDVAINLATQTLKPATINPYSDPLEVEDLEYKDDPNRDNSSIKGDFITLGTKTESQGLDGSIGRVDTTLAKIAFSSGLARSTKLAVLETMLNKYISSTRSIPSLLSRGTRLPFNRRFILQKTGELLELRAQLNHYSELTDSLPDLFWDSRHDLGLEGYYDQVGKALDVGIRIKTLNEKMDYAQEIATILRETMSHKHSSFLEWIIIALIAVEVGFALRKEWKERQREQREIAALKSGNSQEGVRATEP